MSKEWWRGGVIYQIYPRSFMDSNGDGVGDLPGITAKLDHIASLGVDAIWLSPFFKSPMKDFGYDISDYRDVEPMFGTLDDFRAMLDKAHQLGLKIIIDQVMSHTSDQHAWFTESRASRNNPKSDWYVWADPKPDGSPPNNWQSVFGGPSWQYDIRRGQYYLHNFLPEQPDLNLTNPVVQDAILAEAAFWLDLGVDGFRLDALNFGMHNPSLADNPPHPNPAPSNHNVSFPTPFTMQRHINDMNQPGMFGFLEKIRNLLDRYDGNRMAVAEIGGDDCIVVAAQYTATEKLLHTAYNFSLICGDKLSAQYIRDVVKYFEQQPGEPWPAWAFSNHDVVRVQTRWGGNDADDPRLAKLLVSMLSSLRGTVFMYQGEELGLPEAKLTFDQIRDPWGKYLYPMWQGRDGCRTPVPWNATDKNAGFSTADETWLPIPDEHAKLSVGNQEKDPDSTLNYTRAFVAWRKAQPALVHGDIEFHDTGDDKVLAFSRKVEGQSLLCVFNLAADHKVIAPPAQIAGAPVFTDKHAGTVTPDGKIDLPPFAMFYAPV